jgi:hypothetical protein
MTQAVAISSMEEGSVRMSERYMVHPISDSLRDRLSSSSRTSTRRLWIGRTAMSNHGGYRDDHRNQTGTGCWTMAPMNRPEGTCRTMGQAQEGSRRRRGMQTAILLCLVFSLLSSSQATGERNDKLGSLACHSLTPCQRDIDVDCCATPGKPSHHLSFMPGSVVSWVHLSSPPKFW